MVEPPRPDVAPSPTVEREAPSNDRPGRALRGQPKKIWIDLDNSPHVPFFAPIIDELHARGYRVLVTARQCFQVCELASLLKVEHKRIGRHHGKHTLFKVVGLCVRAMQLAPTVLAEKPDVAVSHGSRSQMILTAALRMRSIVIVDYEFARGIELLRPSWVMFPEVIEPRAGAAARPILRYPGIKEDVYVPRFKPDSSIVRLLGLSSAEVVLTIRPPATEAHYHNAEAEALLEAVFGLVRDTAGVKAILLPRNQRQESEIRKLWPGLFDSGKVIVPDRAVDGLNLIWHSDLVISGGGTMNREAAALGVPVYSIFRGEIGAVDRHLAATGRLVLVKSADEVRSKIVIEQRRRPSEPERCQSRTLTTIVDHIISVAEAQ
jgi:hypothetical protein